ncbi:EAL domain-containing protein [Ferrimonas pelagia]|uniref:EAL domain-containing protein n=1 Tax=Ferrimonas pelagia TaxID=1177826 RepID=A0ABP9F2X9_9GAMM
MTLYRQLMWRGVLLYGAATLMVLSLVLVLSSKADETQQKALVSAQLRWMQSQLQQQAQHSNQLQLEPLLAGTALSPILRQLRVVGANQGQIHNLPSSNAFPSLLEHLGLFELEPVRLSIATASSSKLWLEAELTASPLYQTLWQRMLSSLAGALLLGAVFAAGIGLVLRRSLKPLQLIAQRAEDLSSLNFGTPLRLLGGQEFSAIADAINTLSNKLRWELEGYNQQVDSLKRALLTDPVSELPNRTFIMERVDSWLTENSGGMLMLISLKFLEPVRLKFGYECRDELISTFSRALRHAAEMDPGLLVARISAEDFLIVQTREQEAEQQRLVELIKSHCAQVYRDSDADPATAYGIGAVRKMMQKHADELLAQADNALVQALAEPGHFAWFHQPTDVPLFRQQWRSSLSQAIDDGRYEYSTYSVLDSAGDKIQLEISTQLVVGERRMSEAELMPYLKMLGLVSQFERGRVLHAQTLNVRYTPIVFALMPSSLQDENFGHWLTGYLEGKGFAYAFEFGERTVLSLPDKVQKLRRELKNLGYRVGINHFGLHLVELSYVTSLRPDYVKLDQAFVHGQPSSLQQDVCRTLCAALQTLNVAIYLSGVEQSQQLERFEAMPFNGYQDLSQRPKALGGYAGSDDKRLVLVEPLEKPFPQA